jgi:hypothetical protein
MIPASAQILLQDTIKKKAKKLIKIKKTDSACVPGPPAPAAPPSGKIPVAPKAPKAATTIPAPPQEAEAPIAPEIAIIAPLTDMVIKFSADVTDMTMAQLNGKDEAAIKKMQAEIEKKGVELQRKFNSPEQKAKWEKLAADMRAKADSPERKELIKKIQLQAKMAAIDAQKMVNDPQFKKNLHSLTITQGQPMRIIVDNENTRKVKETPEYIELKKKFDQDVEELVNKKNKKDEN